MAAKSGPMTGDSKVEYDAALPDMIGLVEQNWSMTYTCIIKVTANGHGSGDSRTLSFQIQRVSSELV